MKKQSKLTELYNKLRYRKWVVLDLEDRIIIYEGRRELCDLVQDTQYAGLVVVPRRAFRKWSQNTDGGGKK